MCGYFVFSMWTVTHFLRGKKEKKYRFSYMTTVPTINGDFSIPIELCTTFWPLLHATNQSFTFIIYTYTIYIYCAEIKLQIYILFKRDEFTVYLLWEQLLTRRATNACNYICILCFNLFVTVCKDKMWAWRHFQAVTCSVKSSVA